MTTLPADRPLAGTTIPDGWVGPGTGKLERAERTALRALELESAPQRLAEYYHRDSPGAGALLTEMLPNDPGDIVAADLLAIGLLGVEVSAPTVRRLIEPGAENTNVRNRLRALRDVDLAVADTEDLQAMDDLYLDVRAALGPDAARDERTAAAAALRTRKRPDLFPLTGALVRGLLGTTPGADRRDDWLVFRHLVQRPAIQRRLDHVRRPSLEVPGRDAPSERSPLRLLTVALWTSTPG